MATINTEAEKKAYKKFIAAGMTPAGACGLLGNLEAESDGFYPNRVEYLCIKRLKEKGKSYTDESYTAAVDSGKILREEFLHPLPGKQYGYGLAQWTSPGRKAALYELVKTRGVSIADEEIQIDYLMSELRGEYSNVLQVLKKSNNIREASDYVLRHFEQPSGITEEVCAGRAARGQKFYENYVKGTKEITVQQRIEKAISWMEQTANDDSHGYCQDHRWGSDGDYDCSSAVITAWENAGVPVKTKGATYTGNMLGVFTANGFEVVTGEVNLNTGAGLKRGDVLLNTTHHTAMYCGNGKEVEASINEKGTAHGGKPGDQTGKEFLIRSYRNYPWTHILRYVGTGNNSGTATKNYLSKGDNGAAVKTMQLMLIDLGYSCGSAGADGDFGSGTESALKKFQKAKGLEVDGKYGSASKAKLVALHNAKEFGGKKSVEEIAKEVLAGKWSNGDERKKKLEAAGYDYSAVQKKVNELASGSSTKKKSVEELAKEVIAGKWESGDTRKQKLKAAGYDYAAVQKKVNEMLK